MPCSSQHLDSVQLALEQIDLIRRLVNKHPESMVLVTTAEGEAFRLQFYAFVTPAIRPARQSTMSVRRERERERKKGVDKLKSQPRRFFDVADDNRATVKGSRATK